MSPKAKSDPIEVLGVVAEALPRALFRVQLDDRRSVVAHISGHASRNFIRLLPGDRVRVELSSHDVTRGRIVRRDA